MTAMLYAAFFAGAATATIVLWILHRFVDAPDEYGDVGCRLATALVVWRRHAEDPEEWETIRALERSGGG